MNFPARNVYPFVSRKKSGLSGLGFDPFSAAATIAAGYFGGPAAGAAVGTATSKTSAGGTTGAGGAGMSYAPITVSPTIQTAISPQISPVFQQAFQPSGSPMTAGTTQTMPTTQSAAPADTGAPGFATGLPSASGYPDSGVMSAPIPGGLFMQGQPSFLSQYGVYLAAGAGLIVLAMMIKKQRGSSSHALRTV